MFKKLFVLLVILSIATPCFAQVQDPNDPGDADTVYFVAGPPCSLNGDTLYFAPGGGDVTIYINIWNDEILDAIALPLTDSTYGPPSYSFLDSANNNGALNPLCFQGSRVENFGTKVFNLNFHPPQVFYAPVAMGADSLPPGDGLFATMVYTVSDSGRICLDTLFHLPSNELTFVMPSTVNFAPQFVSKCFYLRPYPPPIPDFVGDPIIGEKNLQVSFTDLSEGDVTSWYWSFGDGYSSTGSDPTHTYQQAGSYSVKLIVGNEYTSDSLIKENYIQVLAKPLADFTADPTVGAPPLGVQFTDNSIGNVTSWKWHFGDDDTSSDQHPYHSYSSLGAYDVTLIATGANGSDTTTKENYIFAYPVLSGDSVKVLNITALPNQENVVIPIIQSNQVDSLSKVMIPLTFGNPSDLTIDSVSFDGSRASHFEEKTATIYQEDASILIALSTPDSPCLDLGQGLLAKIYLKVNDVIPPITIILDTTTIDPDTTISYTSCSGAPVYVPELTPGSLYVEKTDYTPPETPSNLVAFPLESAVSLAWDEVTDPDLRFYAIYRDVSSFTPGSLDDTLSTGLNPYYSDFDVVSGQTYFYRVSAVDSSWNESGYSNEVSATFGDVDPPVITLGPSWIAKTHTTATIYWETDEEADGWVEIWVDTSWVPTDSHTTFLLEHAITLNGLVPSTSYEYRVHSTDSLDNGPTYSGSDFFTTASAPDTTPPTISGPILLDKTHNSANIMWVTSEPTEGVVRYGSEEPFDSMSYPGFSATIRYAYLNLLSPETEYLCQVTAVDQSGNGPAYGPAHPGDLSYDVGDLPLSVFCADLNGDTYLDLAVANARDDSVSILINNGNGTFQTAVNYSTGDWSKSVFCADLNGDTYPDLAVANLSDDNVSVLINNGNGTFQTAVNYGTGNGPQSVFSADLDGDTYPDLAVANAFNDNVSVLINNGNGTFQTAVNYGAGDLPHSVFCADLDGDTYPDLAVANLGDDSVSILINNQNGTFQTAVNYSSGDGPHSVFCADLDGDTYPDLAVANMYDDSVSILINNQNGTFQTAVNYSVGDFPRQAFCADLNGDTYPDLAVANHYSNNVSVLINNGNGTFQTAVNYGTGNDPHSVFCADLDGDADSDMALAILDMDKVLLLLNNGEGIFAGALRFTTDAEPDTDPPNITYGPVYSGITHNQAIVEWDTDEPASSIVQYGLSELYGSLVKDLDYVEQHQVILTNLQESMEYHFRVGSVDQADNDTTWSSDLWFETQSAPDTIPPIFLVLPWPNDIDDTQVQIYWETNEPSDSWVFYGIGAYNLGWGNADHVTEHSVVLTGLTPDATYDYYVVSTDLSGNTLEMEHTIGPYVHTHLAEGGFTTKAEPDVAAPTITSGPFVTYKTQDQAIVEWTTDEPANTILEYGQDQSYGDMVADAAVTTNHAVYITDLDASSIYHFRVSSMDIANNGPTYSSDVTFTTAADLSDRTAPVITVAPQVPYLDASLAIITWTTDEPANSYMGYELIGGLAEHIVGESFSVMTHALSLSLASSYNVRIFSSDPYGNGPTYSDYFMVTAPEAPDVTPPSVISGPDVIYLSRNTAKISWETDELSSSFVEYGLSASYTDLAGSGENESLHVVTVTNLDSLTDYHYRIKSSDLFANVYYGSDQAFATGGIPDSTAPLTPAGLASAYGNVSVKLTWNKNADADLGGYNLYRGTTISTLSLIASNLPDTSYQDQGLVNDVTYYYQISAVDQSSNESQFSEMICSKPLSYKVGDFNGNEETDVVDVVALVNYLFKDAEGHEPLEAGNVNCDDIPNITDAVYLVNYLFRDGVAPCICTVPEEPLARYHERSKAILGLCFPFEDKSKQMEVMLEAQMVEEVAGIQIVLSFDPAHLEVKEISTTPRTDQVDLFYNVGEGKVKIGMLDIYGVHTLTPGEGSIIKIKFQKKSNQAGLSSAKIERAVVVNTLAQELDVQIQPNKVIRSIPQTFSLGQNYPNPFNARTVIKYSLPRDSKVKISIYNILGQKVKVLLNEHQSAGHKSVVWDGTNQKDKTVASGVYFYKIQAGDFTGSRKMLLLK